MAEKITYGIKNVYYAPIVVSEGGVVTYGVPAALPGASEISLSTVGNPLSVYADNIVYAKFSVNNGYEGNLSVYSIPDAFARDHLGYKIDGNGVLVEDSTAVLADFALLFEFNTDTAKTKRSVLYSVSASRPEINSTTKEDSIDPQPLSIPLTASPAFDTEYVKASVVGDSSNATWAGWFSSVYTSASTAQYQVAVTITDGSAAIAGALVVCGGKFGKTDSAGKAYFMLANGTYDVLVSASGFVADTDTVTVASVAVTKNIPLTAV